MKDNQPMNVDINELAADLNDRMQEFKREQEFALQRASESLRDWNRPSAQEQFRHSLGWNKLLQSATEWSQFVNSQFPPLYVCDAWTARDIISHLTPGPDEEICHITGSRFGQVRVLSRLRPLKTEKKSVVYAKSTPQAAADAEIEILEQGNRLNAMAHSHPGSGARATGPSSIDTDYLGRIQRAGADAIGIIITRDGFMRFFTVEKPFRVLVTGSGITKLEDNVYQFTLSH